MAGFPPTNTIEFHIAGQFVLASERAEHCLTRADQPGPDPGQPRQWIANADMMMRCA